MISATAHELYILAPAKETTIICRPGARRKDEPSIDDEISSLTDSGAGPVKIGCSFSPFRRIKEYQVWSPVILAIAATAPATPTDERRVHSLFAADRLHHEWFTRTPRLDAFISRLKAGVEVRALIEEFSATPEARAA